MIHPVQRVAVLGARQTGKTWLAAELAQTLTELSVTDGAPWLTLLDDATQSAPAALAPFLLAHRQQHDLTLLMGLDLPGETCTGAAVREPVDAALRAALAGAGLAYKVIYGQGRQRLDNALLAIRGSSASASASRTAAQFGLQGGRVPWRCENCSDPACEHQLFSRLLRS